MRNFLLITLCIFLVSCSSPLIKKINNKIEEYISASELNNMIVNKESVLMIDLRRPLLYNNSHIPGAINISVQDINTITNKISILTFIVIYGQNTAETKPVLKKLRYMGYNDARMLSGGYSTWIYTQQSN